jgi:hypothetical protein
MLAAEFESSAATRSDLVAQVLEHFSAGKLPLDAIADSDLPLTAADDQYPAWHLDTYPFEAIVKALFIAQLRGFSFYYIIPEAAVDIGELFAYLNSPDVCKWIEATTRHSRGRGHRIRTQVLRRLPVPEVFA